MLGEQLLRFASDPPPIKARTSIPGSYLVEIPYNAGPSVTADPLAVHVHVDVSIPIPLDIHSDIRSRN